METLDEFLTRAEARWKKQIPSNAYVVHPGWEHLYVRYTVRYLRGRRIEPVLDLANIAVEEDLRGTGVFSRLMDKLTNEKPNLSLYVENTHLRFGTHLLRIGFVSVPNAYGLPQSYFLDRSPQHTPERDDHAPNQEAR